MIENVDIRELKARANLGNFLADHLEETPTGYVCPECGSGTKQHRTGALKLVPDGEHYHCFACGVTGDVIDAARMVGVAESFAECVDYVERWAEGREARPAPAALSPMDADNDALAPARNAEMQKMNAWRGFVSDPESVAYLESRGLTLEDSVKWEIGFDPIKRRVCIPYPGAPWYHIDRAIDDGVEPKYLKPSKGEVGREPLWNPSALEADLFFVVEGPFDAIAVQECGYDAVALCGTGHDGLVSAVTDCGYAGMVVIMLDSDAAGATAASKLRDKLSGAGVRAFVASLAAKEGDYDE